MLQLFLHVISYHGNLLHQPWILANVTSSVVVTAFASNGSSIARNHHSDENNGTQSAASYRATHICASPLRSTQTYAKHRYTHSIALSLLMPFVSQNLAELAVR